jgi:hypothetical protein
LRIAWTPSTASFLSPRAGPHHTDFSKGLPSGTLNGVSGQIPRHRTLSAEWPLDQLIRKKEQKNDPFFPGMSRSGVKAKMATVESTEKP